MFWNSDWRTRGLRGLIGGAWFALNLTGLAWLANYESTPGASGSAPPRWPSGSPVRHAGGRLTLVLAIHPRCPCTRASLEQLERIMARAEGAIEAVVLFYVPRELAGEPPRRWGGALRRSVSAIPGVSTVIDVGGAEAARFGAATSGHALLYSPDGELLFSGGITGSRGHAGDNIGADAVVDLAVGRPARTGSAPVFGCPIHLQLPQTLVNAP